MTKIAGLSAHAPARSPCIRCQVARNPPQPGHCQPVRALIGQSGSPAIPSCGSSNHSQPRHPTRASPAAVGSSQVDLARRTVDQSALERAAIAIDGVASQQHDAVDERPDTQAAAGEQLAEGQSRVAEVEASDAERSQEQLQEPGNHL